LCSGFLVIDVFPLLLCVFLLDGSTSVVVVGLSPCTALLDKNIADKRTGQRGVQNEDHVGAASDDYNDPVGKGANAVTITTMAR